MGDWHISLDEIGEALPGPPRGRYPEGVPFVEAVRHGSMSVELFAPTGEDRQQPHSQDELYVVLSGSSALVRGDERVTCVAGDVLFVPAGMPHRFVGMSGDFRTWVVLWGPAGGERGKLSAWSPDEAP